MYKKPNMPFRNLITPANTDEPLPDLDRPQYTLRAGFTFDLACLLPENDRARPLITTPQTPLDPRTIQSRTSLDPTQSVALLNTLSRGLSLIQGPPGTGKSYTGKKIIQVLLANKAEADLGPILCVCYTNHALDQLLEHLLEDGNTNVIRIGSQSKSERLKDLNLRDVARAFDRTRGEKQNLLQSRWSNPRDNQGDLVSSPAAVSFGLVDLSQGLPRNGLPKPPFRALSEGVARRRRLSARQSLSRKTHWELACHGV